MKLAIAVLLVGSVGWGQQRLEHIPGSILEEVNERKRIATRRAFWLFWGPIIVCIGLLISLRAVYVLYQMRHPRRYFVPDHLITPTPQWPTHERPSGNA